MNAVVAAPEKVQQFLSDHTDEVTDIATFAIERYVTGGESSEGSISKAQASAAGRTVHPSGEQQSK